MDTALTRKRLIKCPECGSHRNEILETRRSKRYKNTIRRRRECKKCSHRWSTIEANQELIEELIELQQKVAVLCQSN